MNWICVKDNMPKEEGEYFVFERWIEETESGPVDTKLIGLAWFNGRKFCDIVTRWGESSESDVITHWAKAEEPV